MKIARSQAAEDRQVMVLFPTSVWRSAALPQSANIWLRASTVESGLKALSIDTLILVGRNLPEWDLQGERLAHERLQTSRRGQVIYVD
jgi:hypothetical protein